MAGRHLFQRRAVRPHTQWLRLRTVLPGIIDARAKLLVPSSGMVRPMQV